jgi:hypothetical protein
MTTTAISTLKAFAAKQSTATLVEAMLLLDRKTGLAPEERMTAAAIADTLTERSPAANAIVEAAFADESDEGMAFTTEHTYGEIVYSALQETGAI